MSSKCDRFNLLLGLIQQIHSAPGKAVHLCASRLQDNYRGMVPRWQALETYCSQINLSYLLHDVLPDLLCCNNLLHFQVGDYACGLLLLPANNAHISHCMTSKFSLARTDNLPRPVGRRRLLGSSAGWSQKQHQRHSMCRLRDLSQ